MGTDLKSVPDTDAVSADSDFQEEQRRLVGEIASMGIRDSRVLEVMGKVPRHRFVPKDYRSLAYLNEPLPIGDGQTISQPYVVAFMTEVLQPGSTDKVLEIGTGSGYQAAVLSGLMGSVYTIEIVPELGKRAADTLQKCGYHNVHVRIGDGYQGWPEEAPFDAIIITAAAPIIPKPLVEQLKDGGHMILPVGRHRQSLVLLTKEGDEIHERNVLPVAFVPMTGEVDEKN